MSIVQNIFYITPQNVNPIELERVLSEIPDVLLVDVRHINAWTTYSYDDLQRSCNAINTDYLLRNNWGQIEQISEGRSTDPPDFPRIILIRENQLAPPTDLVDYYFDRNDWRSFNNEYRTYLGYNGRPAIFQNLQNSGRTLCFVNHFQH